MMGRKNQKGVLSIEASISYSIFLMVVVTFLYMMRIVYVHALIQHAVSQTAKELSMYTYLYQVSGLNDINSEINSITADRTGQFNEDAANIVSLYESLSSGNVDVGQQLGQLNTDPKEVLKNIAAAAINQGASEVNQLLMETIAKPMLAGYISADSRDMSADARLSALQVVGGMGGLNLSSSSFFEDGSTIDLVVCYTIDPIVPIDVLPKLNLMNRAYTTGMGGKSMFTLDSGEQSGESQEDEQQTTSIWDMPNASARGKEIQKQEGVRNLPDNFKVYSAFDPTTGKATAEQSIDLRSDSYQTEQGIRKVVLKKIQKIENYTKSTYAGVTLDPAEITAQELIIYIPAEIEGRTVDRSAYDLAIARLQSEYPDIRIITKEIE